MDMKEKLVAHLVERAADYCCKLLAVDHENLRETKETLEPEEWVPAEPKPTKEHVGMYRDWKREPPRGIWCEIEDELSCDETARRVYLFERYGLKRGIDFGYWPEDEFCSLWTFAYDAHLPGVREALEIEEWLKGLEWAKQVTYRALIRQRIPGVNEETAVRFLKNAMRLYRIRQGLERCPACGALLDRPKESIRTDGAIEAIQLCQGCKFVLKKEFRLSD